MEDRRSPVLTLSRGEGRWGDSAPRQMLTPETGTPTRTQKRLQCNSTNAHRPVEGGSAAGSHHDTPMRLRRSHPGSQTIAQLKPRGEKGCRQETRGDDQVPEPHHGAVAGSV